MGKAELGSQFPTEEDAIRTQRGAPAFPAAGSEMGKDREQLQIPPVPGSVIINRATHLLENTDWQIWFIRH